MRLLLNSPFKLSIPQRDELHEVLSGLDIVESGVDSPDDLDGTGVDVLVTEGVPQDLSKWPSLGWVQLLSAGANQLIGHPIQRTSIPVATASGTHGVPIAQFVTGAWLMMVHQMPALLEFKASRIWPDRGALAGSSVRGMTVGIVGYGSIGRECARQLRALGMRVVCLKRDPMVRRDNGYNAWPGTGDPEGTIPEVWFGPTQLREMLPRCDLVVVAAPSTPQTQNMMGAEELALMKRSARLIVVSRGGIVGEHALAEALRAKRIAGALVDCFVGEPIAPDHFFFPVPGLIMTPHMSGVYEEFWPMMLGLLAENLRRFSSGEPLLNRVQGVDGY